MIIEYKGEVIRPCLTDKREEIYEKQVGNRISMFEIETID